MEILKKANPEYLYAYAEEVPVALFAEEMRRKLELKRKQGRDGWYQRECTINHLHSLMMDHAEKGDYVDVANFAMMIRAKQAMGHK
jgi:hypothetical protein